MSDSDECVPATPTSKVVMSTAEKVAIPEEFVSLLTPLRVMVTFTAGRPLGVETKKRNGAAST